MLISYYKLFGYYFPGLLFIIFPDLFYGPVTLLFINFA